MNITPIFDNLRNIYALMCQDCTDQGWPYAMFTCAGDGHICD